MPLRAQDERTNSRDPRVGDPILQLGSAAAITLFVLHLGLVNTASRRCGCCCHPGQLLSTRGSRHRALTTTAMRLVEDTRPHYQGQCKVVSREAAPPKCKPSSVGKSEPCNTEPGRCHCLSRTLRQGSPSTKRPELGGFWKLAEEKKLRVLFTAFRRSLQAVAQRKSPVQKGGRPSSSRRCDNSEVRAGCSQRMLNGRKYNFA